MLKGGPIQIRNLDSAKSLLSKKECKTFSGKDEKYMAMPSYEVIRQYYLDGLWSDIMLRTAVVCKAITQEQYEQLLDEKKSAATA